MALLRNPRETPPDGFRFVVRETGARFTGHFLGELADVIIEHRRYKGLEPTDKATVELEIQRQICAYAEPHVCMPENGENWRPIQDQSRSLNPDKVVDFSRSMFSFVEAGGEMVPKAESERRAEICRGCPLNRPSACVCTPLFKLLDSFIPSARREPGMLICGACGCSNAVAILLPLENIKHGKELQFPDFCWQHAKPDGQEKTAT